MTPAGWGEPASRLHTFATGRTAELNTSLPLMWLAERARDRGDDDATRAFTAFLGAGATEDNFMEFIPLMQRDILEHAFVTPRVVYDERDLPSPVPTDADGTPRWVTVRALSDSEIFETVSLVLEEVAKAARFPGQPDGDGSGADGAGVAKPAKSRARAAGGKR